MQRNSCQSSWLGATKCLVALAVLLFGSTALFADSMFITGSLPPGTSTPFSETNNGVTATFTSPADPGTFIVTGSFFSFGPQVLADPGLVDVPGSVLDVAFSAPQSNISLDFGIDGAPGPFELDAYLNGSLVGSVIAMGVIPDGYTFPEGTISFSGTPFDSVVLTSSTTPYFGVANIDTAPIPEPSSLMLLGTALAGAGGVVRRKLAK